MTEDTPDNDDLFLLTVSNRQLDKALYEATKLRIVTRPVEPFPLNAAEKELLANHVPVGLKKNLAAGVVSFREITHMVIWSRNASKGVEPPLRDALLAICGKLVESLQQKVAAVALARAEIASKRAKKSKASKRNPEDTIYQFKITLEHSQPPIWRRIQTRDCNLDELPVRIQAAMGWVDSDIYNFRIGPLDYSQADLVEMEDSRATKISDILSKIRNKPFSFRCDFDLDDFWIHEILLERIVQADPKQQYPLCVDGARACPPEEIGGIWEYDEFLEAIRNPEHPRHHERLMSMGGEFDPEAFDPEWSTQVMRRQRTTGEPSDEESDEE